MIEHMMFKGTSKRSAKELAQEIALLGDDMNAYTSKELTCYYARILDEHLPAMVEILGDMFLNSVFSSEDLEREKSVILDEIDMYEDSPEDLVQEQIQKVIWKNHPLGYIISGTKENVMRITREELVSFWSEYYTAEHIVISVAGHVETTEVVDLLEANFGRLRNSAEVGSVSHLESGLKRRIASVDIPVYQPARACFHKDTEQVHLCLGFPGISHSAPENYAIAILNNIIGGSSCSRLFQKIREDRGLCYSIYSYGSSYYATGTYQIYAGMSEDNVEQVYAGIIHVLDELRQHGPTKEEITQTISQIRSELLLSRENTHNRMSNNAKNLIYRGRMISVEETMQGLQKVSERDILDYMEEYMKQDSLSVVMAGDFKEHPELKNVFLHF
jgi:predicted Zn-dependent peptidase